MKDNGGHIDRIRKLEKQCDKLHSDYGLIRDKLKLEGETSRIQFRSFRRELDASKMQMNKWKEELEREFHETKEDTSKKCGRIQSTADIRRGTDEDSDDNSLLFETTELLKQQLTTQEQLIITLQQDVSEIKNCKSERGKERRIAKYTSEVSIYVDDDIDTPKERPDDVSDSDTTINEEEYEHHYLPNDTFSYLAVSDYFKKKEACFFRPTLPFCVAIFAICFQLTTLFIFLSDVVDFSNPTNVINKTIHV